VIIDDSEEEYSLLDADAYYELRQNGGGIFEAEANRVPIEEQAQFENNLRLSRESTAREQQEARERGRRILEKVEATRLQKERDSEQHEARECEQQSAEVTRKERARKQQELKERERLILEEEDAKRLQALQEERLRNQHLEEQARVQEEKTRVFFQQLEETEAARQKEERDQQERLYREEQARLAAREARSKIDMLGKQAKDLIEGRNPNEWQRIKVQASQDTAAAKSFFAKNHASTVNCPPKTKGRHLDGNAPTLPAKFAIKSCFADRINRSEGTDNKGCVCGTTHPATESSFRAKLFEISCQKCDSNYMVHERCIRFPESQLLKKSGGLYWACPSCKEAMKKNLVAVHTDLQFYFESKSTGKKYETKKYKPGRKG
jgi:hypothetical protein